jgi:hypothetical protein
MDGKRSYWRSDKSSVLGIEAIIFFSGLQPSHIRLLIRVA